MIFSIIIPTHNRAALLREALGSVFRQTFTDYEVIVVDDGGTDHTAEVIAAFGNRIRFYQQKNGGPGAARNLGLQNAVGEYVAFLDSDDLWFPWTLASYNDTIVRNGRPNFVAANCIRFDNTNNLKAIQQAGLRYEAFSDYYDAWQKNLEIVGCGVVVKKAAIKSTGGFLRGKVNAEDSDMWLKLGDIPGFVYLKSPIQFAYRETPASVSKTGAKTTLGIQAMVVAEKSSIYPGGSTRKRERRHILTRHIRPACLGCVKEGRYREAWWFYRESFWWHISLGRVKYLILTPILFLVHVLVSIVLRKRLSQHIISKRV